jgi:DNA (cytosine-5)-methyltransferase 1
MDTLVSGTIQNSGKAAGSATQQDAESKLLIAAPIGGGASGQGRMSEDIPYNVVTHSLTGEGHDASEDGTGRGTPLVMGTLRNHVREGSNTDYTVIQDVRGVRDKKQHGIGIQQGGPMYTLDAMSRHAVGVRRLTPTECERLQGFPDGWTAGFADSTRYKMLGNAVAVPVIEWIGRRINEVIA